MRTIQEMLTLPSFLAWAKTKPPDETFDYVDNEDCAIALFIKDEGYAGVSVSGFAVSYPEHVKIPWDIETALVEALAAGGNNRAVPFGLLVEHLEAVAAKPPERSLTGPAPGFFRR